MPRAYLQPGVTAAYATSPIIVTSRARNMNDVGRTVPHPPYLASRGGGYRVGLDAIRISASD